MKDFNYLLEIASILLGPKGCSWDKEQTLFTLQPYLLEEVHELIEAIDLFDFEKISEELGDVLYTLIFIAKLGEKEGRFSMSDSIQNVCEKLIRRHPHVFGDLQVSSNEEIVKNWEKIKQTEKGALARKNVFDGIPPSLPSLPRAQKMAKKLLKQKKEAVEKTFTEAEIGDQLWELVKLSQRLNVDIESALRRKMQQIEKMPESGF